MHCADKRFVDILFGTVRHQVTRDCMISFCNQLDSEAATKLKRGIKSISLIFSNTKINFLMIMLNLLISHIFAKTSRVFVANRKWTQCANSKSDWA